MAGSDQSASVMHPSATALALEGVLAAWPPGGNGTAILPAEQAHHSLELSDTSLELFDTVVTDLFQAGLSLHVAMDLPGDAAREHIGAALAYLDETIREVRETAFTACGHQGR
jgi:hypothetical protein